MSQLFEDAKNYVSHIQAEADALYIESEEKGSFEIFEAAEYLQEQALIKRTDYMNLKRRLAA